MSKHDPNQTDRESARPELSPRVVHLFDEMRRISHGGASRPTRPALEAASRTQRAQRPEAAQSARAERKLVRRGHLGRSSSLPTKLKSLYCTPHEDPGLRMLRALLWVATLGFGVQLLAVALAVTRAL